MSTEVKIPTLPESVSDAILVNWHKSVGDFVEQGENLIDLETDKVMLEMPAPVSGIIAEILQEDGMTVISGQVIARIEEQKQQHEVPPAKKITIEEPVITESSAAEHFPLSMEERVPMSRLRKKISERLLNVQQTTAMLTTFNEINMRAVMNYRHDFQDDFVKKYGVKLGLMSFFVRAAVAALRQFPVINAMIDGADVVYRHYCNIGIAVASPRGLVVPILRNAENLSFADIERQIKIFAEKAADGSLSLEEISDGTFTITNGGTFGSMLSTPILNPPQSAILGMHAIVDRPMVENGAIVIRPVMYVALSYDHRLIDGREAVLFLKTIKNTLEAPARLLLDL